jgi:hypothetical protein
MASGCVSDVVVIGIELNNLPMKFIFHLLQKLPSMYNARIFGIFPQINKAPLEIDRML